MLLRKAQGGSTLNYKAVAYTWENDGDTVEVPYEFGLELLAIQGGDFTDVMDEPDEPESKDDDTGGDDGKTVTEPAPASKSTVTEPGRGARGGRRGGTAGKTVTE
jgi:hypothetical protein